ncbi:response regulator transcription factor [Collimonas sp. NPDC087041]|uniref:response regulator transcription factor n=1 Tax=Collimonas sp. NPDC087041 TaxID=3363960 RepID=UPI0038245388
MKIAILDDDPIQTKFTSELLTSSGHACEVFNSSKALLDVLNIDSYDLLILDWLIPELNGLEVLFLVRQKLAPNIPVLFVTCRSDEEDIVHILEAGADDYMIKPFRSKELVGRVQALLRRVYLEKKNDDKVIFDDYVFDVRCSLLNRAGQNIELSPKEFEIALLIFRNFGQPVSRAFIREKIWISNVEISSRTIDTHISRIRIKLQLTPENGYRLSPIHRYGYRLVKL